MSTNVNPGTVQVTRGRPVKLGTVTSVNSCVQFTIPEPVRDAQGFIVIQSTGTAGTTVTLEGSIDGGVTWFVLGTSATIVLNLTGQLAGDNPAASADAFQINGMGSGTLFRYGYVGGSPNATVWCNYG
jgi:hypothetical protein